METIYFILFIAACVVVIFWATRRSKSTAQELSATREARQKKAESEKLVTPADTIFSHKNEIWKKRRQHASESYGTAPKFVPRSVSEDQPKYDGYSRRDRHHLKPDVHIKSDSSAEEPEMTSIEFESDQKQAPPQRTH